MKKEAPHLSYIKENLTTIVLAVAAHGDAIAFLMTYLRMGFADAIESLAERFGVALEKIDNAEVSKGPRKPY